MSELVPFLRTHTLRYPIKEIHTRAFRDIFLEVILVYALGIFDILSEVIFLSRLDIKANCVSQILKRYRSVLVEVKPIVKVTYLVFFCKETPCFNKLDEALITDHVLSGETPFIKYTFERGMVAKGSLNESFFQVSACYDS